jgi:hypothetical protein
MGYARAKTPYAFGADVGPTAREFLTRWADERAAECTAPRADDAGCEAEGHRADGRLTARDVAAVTRHVAPLLGDRPLGGVTFGELARLPALLAARGVPPEASRSACRALESALRSAIRDWPESYGRAAAPGVRPRTGPPRGESVLG